MKFFRFIYVHTLLLSDSYGHIGKQSFFAPLSVICLNRTSDKKAILTIENDVIYVFTQYLKGKLSDSFTNYNYVGNTKVSVSIKKT